ncbi:MAG TPA: SDR family NAD(P)-dependent oxidoreductase [Stellaceae bacterium]|jgi:NAD(P)-dependent dehydrogenase (short-subunit alcohol dehydrogenase family)|nr:SDR family NAD(P)-dependent oxidoreductase [Stellaceae bacterium]
MADFRERHVVVTGGTGALGTAVVGELLTSGAICHIPYHVESEELRFAHRGHPRVTLIGNANLGSQTVVQRIYDGVPKLWASIHLAGGYASWPIAETDEAELMGMVRNNLLSCFLCCAAAVASIRKAGGGGRIVNIAARPALEPRTGAGSVGYTVSKAGVAALTQSLAAEVVKEDILVNAIAPSTLDTEANRQAMPKADHAAWPKPADVAAIICNLAAPSNRVTTGAVIPVYGRA